RPKTHRNKRSITNDEEQEPLSEEPKKKQVSTQNKQKKQPTKTKTHQN
ncbi:33272_t:CDS:1, partial [Gigaspora margarita]